MVVLSKLFAVAPDDIESVDRLDGSRVDGPDDGAVVF